MSADSPVPAIEILVPELVERCERAAEGLEFTTYLIGVRGKKTLAALKEHEVLAWKSEVKRGAGLVLGTRWELLGRRPDFVRAELLMIYDLDSEQLEVRIRSVYVYGRYCKLDSDLPQTRARWPCPECKREGCPACEHTGRRYPRALEDLIGAPIAEAFGVSSPEGYQLHGMGREDVDVRCLGRGRPFVLEVKSPRRRHVDLGAAARAVEEAWPGRVELPAGLRSVGVGVVARIKGWESDKVYRAVCEVVGDGRFEAAAVGALDETFSGADLEQRTPERVARRRADKVRRRQVRSFRTSEVTGRRFVAEIDAQSGTYIKELISGDGGRTTPSVAGILGVPTVCARLDVLDIRATDAEILGDDSPPVNA